MINEITYGDIRIHGKNISMNEFIGNLTELGGQFKTEGLSVTDITLSLSFISEKTTSEGSIVIDREDFDRITDYKYAKDDGIVRISKFLQPYIYHWMTEIEICEFINRFISLYNEIEFDKKFIPPSDPIEFCLEEDPMDINHYFKFHNIPYEFRHVCGKYQLRQKHLVNY